MKLLLTAKNLAYQNRNTEPHYDTLTTIRTLAVTVFLERGVQKSEL